MSCRSAPDGCLVQQLQAGGGGGQAGRQAGGVWGLVQQLQAGGGRMQQLGSGGQAGGGRQGGRRLLGWHTCGSCLGQLAPRTSTKLAASRPQVDVGEQAYASPPLNPKMLYYRTFGISITPPLVIKYTTQRVY